MAYLKSTTAYVYDKLNAPVGTKMVFNQTTSPLGWTKETGANNVSLRLVSGTVGTGGTVAFETAFASVTPTISQPSATSGAVASHTLSEGELDPHKHGIYISDATTHTGAGAQSINYSSVTTQGSNPLMADAGSGSAHTHSFTQPTISTPTCSAINLDVSYVDVMIATKG